MAVNARDPVCGMSVDPGAPAASRMHQGTKYLFCAPVCAAAFDREPEKYLGPGVRPADMPAGVQRGRQPNLPMFEGGSKVRGASHASRLTR